ncbi:MAG: hypothetical protein SNJ55_03185 [Chloroherpetonaceae bacterium]
MTKFLFHIFLSLLLSLVSLTIAHHHAHSETISISDVFDSDAHCDICAMKSALQSCDTSDKVEAVHLLPERISFEPSFSSHFIIHFSPRLPSRAPPCLS